MSTLEHPVVGVVAALQDLSMHDRGIVFNQSNALDQAVCNTCFCSWIWSADLPDLICPQMLLSVAVQTPEEAP